MREILFRGKREDDGEWVYGSFIPDMLEVFQGVTSKWLGDWGVIKPFSTNKDERHMQYVKRESVGQYTGFVDSNGSKIFEGDVVNVKSVRIDGDDIFENAYMGEVEIRDGLLALNVFIKSQNQRACLSIFCGL